MSVFVQLDIGVDFGWIDRAIPDKEDQQEGVGSSETQVIQKPFVTVHYGSRAVYSVHKLAAKFSINSSCVSCDFQFLSQTLSDVRSLLGRCDGD